MCTAVTFAVVVHRLEDAVLGLNASLVLQDISKHIWGTALVEHVVQGSATESVRLIALLKLTNCHGTSNNCHASPALFPKLQETHDKLTTQSHSETTTYLCLSDCRSTSALYRICQSRNRSLALAVDNGLV